MRVFIIIFYLCALFGNYSNSKDNIPIKSRFLVPIYLKYGLSIGYDDNVFRFSDSEKNNDDSYSYMGSSETYDSSIIKPTARVLYSPYLFKDKLTNFIFYFNLSNYNEIKDKSNQLYSIRFDYRVGPYNWFKIGYRSTKNNFLRYYTDQDMPGNKYTKCSYDSESIYFSYSFNFNRYGWSRIKFSKSNQFFNPSFTEFDLDILRASINHNYRYKTYSLNITAFKDIASNTSYKSGLNSSRFDRSYNTLGVNASIKKEMSQFLSYIKLGGSISERSYTSQDSSLDALHSKRSHIETSFFIQLSKKIKEKITVDLKYNFIYRDTNSDLDWFDGSFAQNFDIDALKSFKQNQILIKFSYDMEVDLFY